MQDLNNDIISFEFYKKNGEANRNGFLNTLLKNYFSIYDEKVSEEIDRYEKVIKNHVFNEAKATDLINELLSSSKYFSFQKSDTLDSPISIKLSNSNYNIYRIIESKYLNYQSVSSFFRNMIESYLELPKYKREQIIYLDTFELISEAIKDSRKIRLFTKSGADRLVMPCIISTNKEELFNYLLCFTESKNDCLVVNSFHLSKIDSVFLLKEKFNLKEEEISKINNVVKNGAQFPYTNACNAKIQLTKEGQRLYKKKYLNRPNTVEINDDIYSFCCSFDQLVLYFFSFGKDANVIYPDYLKNTLKNKYLEAYNSYSSEEFDKI